MTINELIEKSRAQKIPVIRDDSARLLIDLIKSKRPKRILEIGTAVGCSGILMLNEAPEATLVTVENDPDRHEQALRNFNEFGYAGRVKAILDDCTAVVRYLEGKYDLIFLDGPKGQYPDMLPYLLPLLSENGAMFVDDVSFFGAVNGNEIPPHKNRTIIMELRRFRAMLESDKTLRCEYFDTEDGSLIVTKIS